MTWNELKAVVDRKLKDQEIKDIDIGYIDISGLTADGKAENLAIYVAKVYNWLEIC